MLEVQMRANVPAIVSAVLFSSILTAQAAHGECVKVPLPDLLSEHKGSILLQGNALSITETGEPDRVNGMKVIFQVERVWKGSVGRRIEIYKDFSPEQARFEVGGSSYVLVVEITNPARRRFFGITGTDTLAYASVHCGLEDYSVSEITGALKALGLGSEPRKDAAPRGSGVSALAMYDNNGRNMATVTRRPGRPPLDPEHPSASVNLRLPGPTYDALHRLTQRDRASVPETIRRKIARDHSDDERDGNE
jgi:hypothetical protein